MKEWKREQKGRGLYDTSSSDSDEKEIEPVHLTNRQKLEREVQYLTEKIIALGELHNTYSRDRNNSEINTFDFAILDRERNKVAVVRRVY